MLTVLSIAVTNTNVNNAAPEKSFPSQTIR